MHISSDRDFAAPSYGAPSYGGYQQPEDPLLPVSAVSHRCAVQCRTADERVINFNCRLQNTNEAVMFLLLSSFVWRRLH